MIVAKPVNLKYISNPDEHTVNYDRKCSLMADVESIFSIANFKWGVFKDIESAAKKLIGHVGVVLIQKGVKPEDFRFDVAYENIDSEGFFWGNLTMSIKSLTPE